MEVIIENVVPYLHEALHRYADVDIEEGSNEDILCYLVTGYSLYLFGGVFFYLFFASISYYYYFVLYRQHYFPGKKHLPSVEVLREQVRTEIGIALPSIPVMALLTVPFNILVGANCARVSVWRSCSPHCVCVCVCACHFITSHSLPASNVPFFFFFCMRDVYGV
jgi:hypothetical protein